MKNRMLRVILLIVVFLSCVFEKTESLLRSNDNSPEHYHDYLHKDRVSVSQIKPSEEEATAAFWRRQANATLHERLKRSQNTNLARNVIFFLGDGMSHSTIAAARTLLGQRNNKSGEETQLSFEKFPNIGLSKTYCVDSTVADSACSATAYLCGVKANDGTLGVTAAVKYKDCAAMNNRTNHVYSIAHLSQQKGKRTGIVTTTRITHASPAGAYAHSANRDWESDSDVKDDKQDPKKCIDIAQQLIYGPTGKNFNVIFGGGKGSFIPKNYTDEYGHKGWRSDNRDLIEEWKMLKNGTRYKYVYNVTELKAIPNNTDYVLGLFTKDHMDYNVDRNASEAPSLEEMTLKAIDLLSQGDNGYFLFVEGGRIDHAHHSTKAKKALDETIEFHKAIQAAADKTDESSTLIIVTADHAHTMTLNGYPLRGTNILGIGGEGKDDLPYTTLSYANGPSKKIGENGGRPNVTEDNFSDPEYVYPSLVPLSSETHGGEDVGIYAKGPWAHLFIGVTEQNVIPHIVKYASCVSEVDEPCAK